MRLICGTALLALALSGCTTMPEASEPVESVAQAQDWDSFRNDFIEGYMRHFPDFAVYQGRHEFDGQLPDVSKAGLASMKAFLGDAIARAAAMEGLSPGDEIERKHLILVAGDKLFELTDEGQPERNPRFYLSILDPGTYTTVPYAPPAERLAAFIGYARNVPELARQAEANLVLPFPEPYLQYARGGFGGMATYYETDARAAFAGVGTPEQQADLIAATGEAAAAMRRLVEHISSAGSTPDGWALGAERFSKMLRVGEAVDVPLAELEAIGRRDLARNQASLRDACGEFAPGASLGDCMQKMEATKSPGGPVAGARRQLPDLRAFLVANDIVTIPGTEQALVEESPPYNRSNSAYISIPGPYEKGLPSTYYISPPDPSWDAETQAAFVPGEKELLFTSIHEVWPGHFLQFLHSNRSEKLFPRVFVTYGLAEGWGHYTEEMMWDAGYGAGDPETHIGQLAKALLRNCRYLSAIGLHTQGWTLEQSRDLFRDECYQDEGTAIQQAARGTGDPRYLNYTLGKLQIMRLRDDWTATRGGRKAWKAFHDTFLSYGGAPIPLIRQAMMGEDEPRAVF